MYREFASSSRRGSTNGQEWTLPTRRFDEDAPRSESISSRTPFGFIPTNRYTSNRFASSDEESDDDPMLLGDRAISNGRYVERKPRASKIIDGACEARTIPHSRYEEAEKQRLAPQRTYDEEFPPYMKPPMNQQAQPIFIQSPQQPQYMPQPIFVQSAPQPQSMPQPIFIQPPQQAPQAARQVYYMMPPYNQQQQAQPQQYPMWPTQNQNIPEKEKPPPMPFTCYPLDSEPSEAEASKIDNFGPAQQYLNQVTIKLFNPSINPGRVLSGIIYLDVKQPFNILKADVKFSSMLTKVLSGKETGEYNKITKTFALPVVMNTTASNLRDPLLYQKRAEDFSSSNIFQELSLEDNIFEGSEERQVFRGPILLLVGTHAIPFSLALPDDMQMSTSFEKRNAGLQIKIGHKTTACAELIIQPREGNNTMNVIGNNAYVDIQSCGALPAVVDGSYSAGDVYLFDVPSKDPAQVLIILEKKNHLMNEYANLCIYCSDGKAVKNVFVELVQSINIPEIQYINNDALVNPKKTPGLDLLFRSKKVTLKKSFLKHFASKVATDFPIDPNFMSITGARAKTSVPIKDDRAKMAEAKRVVGALIKVPLSKVSQPSFAAGDVRVMYHIRFHFNLSGYKGIFSQATPITVNMKLQRIV